MESLLILIYGNLVPGNISTDQNPSYDYYNPGSYLANLTIMDSHGNVSSFAEYILVPPNVQCSINANATNIEIGDWVQFVGNSSGGYMPYTYNWIFGDGYISTLSTPIHQFNSGGTFNVNLTVQDSNYNVKSTGISVYVSVPVGYYPVASFDTNATAIDVGQSIQFTSTSQNGLKPYGYVWHIQGSTIALSPDSVAIYTFPNPGIYNVTLTIFDARGNNSTAWKVITVNSNSSNTNTENNSSNNPFPSIAGYPITIIGIGALIMVVYIFRRTKFQHKM